MRTLAHVVLIITPAALGLLMNWQYARFVEMANGSIWWIGATGTVLSLAFLLSAHWWRRKLYREIEWQDTAG